jgi:RNA polymerase II subunit A-like phosphatase
MLVRLPRTLHYPITITELLKDENDEVEQNAPLFSYSYTTTVTETNRFGEDVTIVKTFPSRFESPVEGVFKGWKVEVGASITASVDVAEIEEPCSHPVQFAGMCTICGKDMTLVSYNTESNADRAPITMIHDQVDLKVSTDEAARVEEEAKRRLLQSRKLSLVVDLDQTIIHATVDPTVMEWQRDKNSPNYPAVKDVRAFQLVDDGPGGGGCWYYIKLRPGLEEFLEKISKIYELHIYTMGTRAYARAIANIVDPDGRYFGDRILSRDESGSLTTKNLQRLFPVDTKMVIIIDDRGDVWKWSDNLIRVRAFEFFVGIGDINSSFLPKIQSPPAIETPKLVGNGASKKIDPTEPNEEPLTTLEQLVSMGGGDDPTILRVQADKQNEALAAQQNDRPLMRQQEQLDAEDEVEEQNGTIIQQQRHKLLSNEDNELFYLERALTEVHRVFFKEFDERLTERLAKPSRVAKLRDGMSGKLPGNLTTTVDLQSIPDVKQIMPAMKMQVLDGAILVFTGIVPNGQDVQTHDLSFWARSFGAHIYDDISKEVTHVVSAKDRTNKMRQASRHKEILIVTREWLWECFSQWRWVNETPYLFPVDENDRGGKNSESEEDGFLDEPLYDADWASEKEPVLSPVDGMEEFDWKQTNDELDEFLGSDVDSDEESIATPRPSGKRSRSSSPAEPEDDPDPDTLMADAPAESRLAKRLKMARTRTSSLREVTSVESLHVPNMPSPARSGELEKFTDGDSDFDDFDKEFEAEMEAAAREEDEA